MALLIFTGLRHTTDHHTLLLDLLAPTNMGRVVRSLAFDATVTGEVTIATSLGWDTGLVWAGGAGAGL